MKVFGTDYDGVIINIEPQKTQAFGEILYKHWKINIKEATNFWLANGGTSRKYKFHYFYEKAYHKQLSDEVYKNIELEYSQMLKRKYYPKLSLLPGAKELLIYAKNNYDYLFVSSGVPLEEITYLVDLNGLSKYFDIILGTNNKYVSKYEHFKKIIEENKPDSIVYVADSPEDMKISKKFPYTTAIGVLTNHSEQVLKKAGADYTAKDLFEVKKLLLKF